MGKDLAGPNEKNVALNLPLGQGGGQIYYGSADEKN